MPRSYLLLLFLYCLVVGESVEDDNDFVTKRINHRPLTIEPQKLALISNLSNKVHLKNAVEKILVPRVVGTEGHTRVQEYIKNSMISLNWHVENDTFEDQTPNFGRLTFENIIATVNPDAERFLVLACHYDSKYIPDVEFLGATDSAVPCAMLINLAHTLKDHLTKIATKNDLSLMFIFFDGEEAFHEWGPTDSIYGARHLAKKWKDENFLSRLDMLMLIDLIGMPDPKFYSFFRNTETWYAQLLHSEERLAADGHLENYTTNSAVSPVDSNRYFQPRSANSYIEDDHIPFLNLGVPIMHLIPVPFPEVWHKDTDNHEIVDYTTVENINKILRIFVIEYLNIEIE